MTAYPYRLGKGTQILHLAQVIFYLSMFDPTGFCFFCVCVGGGRGGADCRHTTSPSILPLGTGNQVLCTKNASAINSPSDDA